MKGEKEVSQRAFIERPDALGDTVWADVAETFSVDQLRFEIALRLGNAHEAPKGDADEGRD